MAVNIDWQNQFIFQGLEEAACSFSKPWKKHETVVEFLISAGPDGHRTNGPTLQTE